MKKKQLDKKLVAKDIFVILLVVALFVAAAIFAKRYDSVLKEIPYFQGYFGAIVYIIVAVIAVVIAPISTLPLLPLAVSVWGSFLAAMFSIIGWSVGAAIAFWIARRYGKPIVAKMMPLGQIQRIEKFIPENNIFIGVILLRMALPVDVLSYGLGLFSSIPFKLYIIATIIGVAPFAFFFSYAIVLPLKFQLLFLVLAVIVLIIGIIKHVRKL